MELDELKLQLKQEFDNSNNEQKTVDEIALLLNKKATSVIYKLKKSLWLEIFFSAICTLAFLYIGLYNKHWSLRVYFTVFTIFCFLFTIMLFIILKQTKKLSHNLSVKQSVQKIHHIISIYTKRYFQFTMALIPITMGFAFWLGYHETASNTVFNNTITIANNVLSLPKHKIVFIVVYILIFTVSIYFFTKWYLHKLYGKYLIQLQNLLIELE